MRISRSKKTQEAPKLNSSSFYDEIDQGMEEALLKRREAALERLYALMLDLECDHVSGWLERYFATLDEQQLMELIWDAEKSYCED